MDVSSELLRFYYEILIKFVAHIKIDRQWQEDHLIICYLYSTPLNLP